EQPDHGDPLAERVFAHARDLVFTDGAHRPRHHGEVVRRDRDRATVDLTNTSDRTIRREVAITETGIHVVGEQSVLHPRSRIEQEVETLAHGQLAERVLTLDEIGTAHAVRAVFARLQLTDERTPVVLRVAHVNGSTPRSTPRPVGSAVVSHSPTLPLRRALL